jgi:subtilase family serine protease
VADWNAVVPESIESNNTRTSGVLRIGPDLAVSALVAPASAAAGTPIAVSDTTVNQGGDPAPTSVTKFYLSANTIFDASDVLIGSRQVPSLGPGQSSAGTVSLTIPSTTTPGSYVIIAQADGDGAIAESLETNNLRTRSISITAPPSP